MAVKKSFQELEFKDAFLFALTMEDEEICRGVLERILGIPVRAVKVRSENALLINSDYRGVRMDVFADDQAGTVFDVEMQTTDRKNLPRRSRFYQAQMDSVLLKPGDDFNLLPKSYVIFLCCFDPFGRGRSRYTFEERCIEDGYGLGDGTSKVFLNTAGEGDGQVAPELVRFLSYAGGGPGAENARKSEDQLIHRIDTRISSLKHDRRMEEQYMLFGEMLDDERKEGFADGFKAGENSGREQGEGCILLLIARMKADGFEAEITRLGEDPAFLQEMYKRYGFEP